MPRLAVLLALAAAMAVGSASGVGPASADNTTPSTYNDPTGDSGTAPDITRVTMTPGSGIVTVDITFTGDLGSDANLVLLIDADRNAATGSNGYEYLLNGSAAGLAFGKWDGTEFAGFDHQPTNPELSSTDMQFTITLADIGGVSTFDFVSGSVRGNDTDVAPDNGATYPSAPPPPPPPPPPPAPTVKAVLLPNAIFTAKAGGVLHVGRLQVQLSDGSVASVSNQTCTLTLKGQKLKALAGGCAWKLPKADRGKRLTLTVHYTYAGKARVTTSPVYPR
jgi:hypothetical protein